MTPAAADPISPPAPTGRAATARAREPLRGIEVALKALLVLALLYTAYFGQAILRPLALAVLLALLLAPAVGALKRWGLPEPVGAAIVVLGLAAVFASGAYLLFDPARQWLESAPRTLRQAEYKLRGIKKSMQEVSKAAAHVEEIAKVEPERPAAPKLVASEPRLVSRVLAGTQSVLPAAGATIVLLYFLLASGDKFLRKLVRTMPDLRRRKQAVRITRSIRSNLGRYLITVSLINAGLGAATGVLVHLLGLPNPLLWGVLVAALNFMPYVGAIVSTVVLTAVAFLTFDQLGEVLTVPALFFVLTVFEGQILTPLATGRRLMLNPVAIFLAMLFWGWLWGVLGALMAVPILMVIKVLCDHIDSAAPLGEFLADRPPPAARLAAAAAQRVSLPLTIAAASSLAPSGAARANSCRQPSHDHDPHPDRR
jgi:predicted PurR-regulated permease PerM